MGWLRRTAVALVLGGAACWLCAAQSAPPERGPLVLWVVQSDPPLPPNADEVRRTLHTATAGSFGTNASDVGQAAGSYGASAGSSIGRAGRGASSQPAGSVGTTPGSFGQSLDTVASAGNPPATPQFEPAVLAHEWQGFTERLRCSVALPRTHVVPVRAVDLQQRFAALDAGGERPDVLLGDVSLVERNPFLSGRVLTRLGYSALDELPPGPRASTAAPLTIREWLILNDAPHPGEARSFAACLRDGPSMRLARRSAETVPDSLLALAQGAAESLLRGTPIAGADRTMVAYAPAVARRQATAAPSDEVLNGLQVQVEVVTERANDRFAVFGLRALLSSPQAFGVVYPMVVLRRTEEGRWTVLHVTGDVHAAGLAAATGLLQPFTARWPPETLKPVRSITQAAPVDGDIRAGMPDLWWDDPGDAEELVVEWSKDHGGAHLLCFPDTGPRLQVRVPASFADGAGEYRWRVWSVGKGGVLDLSPWRRFAVLP